MKQTTFENIKQLDISLGGGITSEKIRIDTINHPVLIIGLGGTGTDALLRLKYQALRRFKLPDNPVTKQKKSKPDNIEYLSFETNEHDKKKYKGIALDPYAETVLLSNAGIGSILNNRSTMPDYIKSWLAPELTITDGTKGASGNRQAGRLLLFEKINTAIDAIDNKIRSLRTDRENKLLVFILSGLSGGTGGGMFLDIAYIIRGLMERDYGSKGLDKVEIMGYLFTPDVHISSNQLNIHTEEYIQRNGYAALKELDYWMNIEERQGERFCQKYGTRLDVASGLAPFNLCHLISSSNIDGVHIKGAYDYCMNVTAENIVNFLALEEKESGQEFAIQDYNSNLLSNISTMKSNLPPGMPQSANFVYNIIGASAARLPTEGINAYLAYSLFNQLKFETTPDDYGLSQFMQNTKLDIDSLGKELARNLPPIKLDYAETDYYSYTNVIKTRRVNIDEKLTDLYNAAKRAINANIRTISTNVIETLKTELKSTFTKHGPNYTSLLITSDRYPCLLSRLQACRQHLREKAARAGEDIESLELLAVTKLEEAAGAFLFTKEQKKNTYIETKIKSYQARLGRDCFESLIDAYKEISSFLESENDKVYAIYVEILSAAAKILETNITNPPPPEKDWNIIETADTIPEINNLVNEASEITREFTKSLLEESVRYLDENQPDIVGALSDFTYNQFGSFLSNNMSEFLKLKFGKDRIVEHIIEGEIAPRLFRDAKPAFNLDNAAGMFNFPSYGMVSVPWNAPDILRGIESYQQQALSNLRFNIRKSTITDRIFWLNTQNGIPLFAYTPIRVYEELYERTIQTKEGVGRHLVMNHSESWVNLPSPIPESLWGDTYFNPRQKSLNDEARNLFYDSLENGVIKNGGNHYTCGIGETKRMIFNTTTTEEACEHFTRNPYLMQFVKEETEKLTDSIEENNEQTQQENFLKALVFEAIVKRGATYIYDKELEDDPWPPFVNLIDHAEYPEYKMFQTYKTLTPRQLKMLQKKAQQESWPEDGLMINLQKWQGKIAVRKNRLDQEMHKLPNGGEMYTFYKSLLLRLNSQILALAG